MYVIHFFVLLKQLNLTCFKICQDAKALKMAIFALDLHYKIWNISCGRRWSQLNVVKLQSCHCGQFRKQHETVNKCEHFLKFRVLYKGTYKNLFKINKKLNFNQLLVLRFSYYLLNNLSHYFF